MNLTSNCGLTRLTGGMQCWIVTTLFVMLAAPVSPAWASPITTHPYLGITRTTDTFTLPTPADQAVGAALGAHQANVNVIAIDLSAPGLSFKLSPATPSGGKETTQQQTLAFMNAQNAQLAINTHFFEFSSSAANPTNITGVAASLGSIYSPFQQTAVADLNYAITTYSPGLNISSSNVAKMVYRGGTDTSLVDAANNSVAAYNTVSGSAQIITNGVKTLPPIGSGGLDGSVLVRPTGGIHWYTDQIAARTGIGLSQDGNTLFLFTVDAAGGSLGMTVSEEADYLRTTYGVWNALNLDGGGSTTLAMQDPLTHLGSVINASSGGPRFVAASLAVYASPVPEPSAVVLVLVGGTALVATGYRCKRQRQRSTRR